MTAGPVNRPLLESFFQNPGDIYSDAKTEGCLDVLADQIDENWTPLSNIFGVNGSTLVGSPPIVGVAGSTVHQQLVDLEAQVQAIIGSSIPAGSISTAMLQDGSVTYVKLNPLATSAPTVSRLMLRDAAGRSQVVSPSVANDVANKSYADSVAEAARPYVSGTYTGNGVATRDITLSFTPSAVIVLLVTGEAPLGYGGLAVTGRSAGSSGLTPSIAIGTNKFTVAYLAAGTSPKTNDNLTVYNYIAFK